MTMDDIRKILKENELTSYEVLPKERKIIFSFVNNHMLTVEVDGHPGINYEWDEGIVVKMNGELIAST